MPGVPQHTVPGCPPEGVGAAGPVGRNKNHRNRLQRILRRRPGDAGSARGDLLPETHPGDRAAPRGRAFPQRPAGEEAVLRGAGLQENHPENESDSLFCQPDVLGHAQQGSDRSRGDRRVHRPGRVFRSGQGLAGHDPGANRRGGQAFGSAGPRRSRFPHRSEMGVCPQERRRREVRALQCRRGRPRGLHGSQRARIRSACRARGHDHRRQGHRRPPGLHLCQDRVPAGRQAPGHRHPPGQGVRPARQEHPRDRVRFRCRHLPGRRRLRVRRGDGPDALDRRQARHAASPPAVSGHQGPVGKTDHPEQRRNPRQHRSDHAERRPLVRQRRNRGQQGHESVCALRGCEQYRPG